MNDRRLKKKADQLISLFDKAPIKHTFGMELSFNEKFEAAFDMPYNHSLDHAYEGVHGGVMSTLLDNAGWFTAAIHYETWITTINLNVEFLERAEKIHIRSTGKLVRAGGKIATARMELMDDAGKLLAIGQGSFFVTSVPLKI